MWKRRVNELGYFMGEVESCPYVKQVKLTSAMVALRLYGCDETVYLILQSNGTLLLMKSGIISEFQENVQKCVAETKQYMRDRVYRLLSEYNKGWDCSLDGFKIYDDYDEVSNEVFEYLAYYYDNYVNAW